MNSRILHTFGTNRVYTHLWSKYRPVILQLMVASAKEPQQYRLYKHEFQALNPKVKADYTFTLEAFRGKAVNNIRNSTIAQDLLTVLQQSGKASELMEKGTYEFQLNKEFMLRINRKSVEVETIDPAPAPVSQQAT